MLLDFLEDYVNDIVVKTKKVENHVHNLRMVLIDVYYNLKMNPLKFPFHVSSSEVLKFIVHKKRDRYLDLAKAKAI